MTEKQLLKENETLKKHIEAECKEHRECYKLLSRKLKDLQKENELLESALDIAVFNLVYRIEGLGAKEQREKKEEIKKFCLEVAELMVGLNKGKAKFKKIK